MTIRKKSGPGSGGRVRGVSETEIIRIKGQRPGYKGLHSGREFVAYALLLTQVGQKTVSGSVEENQLA